MVHQVKVRQPVRSVDHDVLARALGEAPLELSRADYVPAPWLTIDDRIHSADQHLPVSPLSLESQPQDRYTHR